MAERQLQQELPLLANRACGKAAVTRAAVVRESRWALVCMDETCRVAHCFRRQLGCGCEKTTPRLFLM